MTRPRSRQDAEVAALLACRRLITTLDDLIQPGHLTDLQKRAAARAAWHAFDSQLTHVRDRANTGRIPTPRSTP